MMTPALARRADALAAAGSSFVAATVVRAARPTSVAPGDSALVLADGTIEGFVGGACAEASVRLHAARALETGESVLLRITPGDDDAPAGEGAVSVRNPCLSGGALEIFLEPRLPAPVAVVVGDGPVARAVAELLGWMGWEARRSAGEVAGAAAVVVATHGGDEEPPLREALAVGVPYVALIASRRRGAAMVEALRAGGCDADVLARLHTPAGLALGARGAHEIALAVVAELVGERHASPQGVPAAHTSALAMPAATGPGAVTDPVCGMTVAVGPATPHLDHGGGRVHFCGEGCRRAFAADPAHDAGAR